MTSKADKELDSIITDITAGAADDGASTKAFFDRIQSLLKKATLGNRLGHRVHVEAVEYDNPRRGIVAVIKLDGRLRRVGLLDVLVAGRSKLAKTIKAYQRWAGAPTEPEEVAISSPKAEASDTLHAAVLKTGWNSARIRPVGDDAELSFKGETHNLVPGHIVTIKVRKRWNHRSYEYVSGEVESMRIDVPALRLPPLGLRRLGPMSPLDHEPYEEELAKLTAMIGSEPRDACEFERVDLGKLKGDPLFDAIELWRKGDGVEAEKLLMNVLHQDLRAIAAHSCLGHWALDQEHDVYAEKALAHFMVGAGIGDQALGDDFDGCLPWGMLDNRHYLRCLHGNGVALWRLRRPKEAKMVFERVCRLNPTDNTGARLCWLAIKRGMAWSPEMW